MFRFIQITVIALTVVLLLVSPAIADGPLTARQIVEMNKPGTVMIQTTHSATITVPEAQLCPQNFAALEQYIVHLMQQGHIPATEEAALSVLLEEVLSNPLQYIIPSAQMITTQVDTGGAGTGFIIRSDGYIITNAHCVYADEEQLKYQLVLIGLQEIIEQDVNDFIAELVAVGFSPSEEVIQAFRDAAFNFYLTYLQVGRIETRVFTAMGIAVPGLETIQRGFVSDIRTMGAPVPGKDVAILKIDRTDLPTVRLGDDSAVRTGDQVYVLGYPAVATFHPLLSGESVMEPTLTAGLISAKKSMPGGWEVFQCDAAISHGNSGGPVFNDRGEVIGIATFGSIDPATGGIVQGMGFVIPISIAQQFLSEINVQSEEGRLTKLYHEALALVDKHHYKPALEKFREVYELNSAFPYVQDYISSSRNAIAQGRDRTPNYMLIIGCSIVGIVVLGGGAVVALRRRKTQTRQV